MLTDSQCTAAISRPTYVVSVSGFTSGVGKTTLICDLLGALPGWEAIKVSRGRYCLCGKDISDCQVGHESTEEPQVYSGREMNYLPGKDSARYWDAGAVNVHWVIVPNERVGEGVGKALDRVCSRGVLIEGNSVLESIKVHFAVMVARASGDAIKPSARRALQKVDALYLTDEVETSVARRIFAKWNQDPLIGGKIAQLPVYTRAELPQLVVCLKARCSENRQF